jgi:hypothetical protein
MASPASSSAIPIRTASPAAQSHQGSPSLRADIRQIPRPGSGTPNRQLSSSFQQTSPAADRAVSISEAEKARIVRAHLPGLNPDLEGDDLPVFEEECAPTPSAVDESETYHKMLGGDVTHDLYKYASDQATRPIRRPRSASFTEGNQNRRGSHGSFQPPSLHAGDSADEDDPTLDIRNIRQPGGALRKVLQRCPGLKMRWQAFGGIICCGNRRRTQSPRI